MNLWVQSKNQQNGSCDRPQSPEVQRLVAGGKRAALPLVARGQLRVEGDLGELQEAGDRSGDGRFGILYGPNLVPFQSLDSVLIAYPLLSIPILAAPTCQDSAELSWVTSIGKYSLKSPISFRGQFQQGYHCFRQAWLFLQLVLTNKHV